MMRLATTIAFAGLGLVFFGPLIGVVLFFLLYASTHPGEYVGRVLLIWITVSMPLGGIVFGLIGFALFRRQPVQND